MTAPGYPACPPASQPYGGAPGGQATFAHRNQLSLTTLVVVALYILVAVSTHLAFIGILPVVLSIRAASRREPLAPLAVVGAVAALVVGITTLAHH
ncbi:MAG TPA: hypothetical protein VKG43_01040 [Acidimicrobiales bacterium]|nr:hypothetical protein [Acidimicrobiales bacterium]